MQHNGFSQAPIQVIVDSILLNCKEVALRAKFPAVRMNVFGSICFRVSLIHLQIAVFFGRYFLFSYLLESHEIGPSI